MKTVKIILLCTIIAFLFVSCAPGPARQVGRLGADDIRDLSGFWNDTDVRIVSESLINDFLNSPRAAQALARFGERQPVVLVGSFRNESMEHIDTAIIASTLETVIFNTGRMDFVAGGAVRDEIRAERRDQLAFASEESAAALAAETGADFMMFGTVRTMVDRVGNRQVRTYFVSAEMTCLETNQRIWMATNNEIRKEIVQARHRI